MVLIIIVLIHAKIAERLLPWQDSVTINTQPLPKNRKENSVSWKTFLWRVWIYPKVNSVENEQENSLLSVKCNAKAEN